MYPYFYNFYARTQNSINHRANKIYLQVKNKAGKFKILTNSVLILQAHSDIHAHTLRAKKQIKASAGSWGS